jgi:hypothetical protein
MKDEFKFLDEFFMGYFPEREPQLMSELRDRGFSTKQIIEIIKVIDDTCKHCWNGPSGCQCWNDE